ncbi:class I SAM-dependent methyltransferase [Arenibacter sp. F26102]|uniref:class I SAM-dependent methyltransferase n=1 Tax=Arenibacter sp. F26102 TaxID=2926416 RepID=UPI0032B24AFB
MRNRYFLESIKESIKESIRTSGIEVLINFGAGFSMYPFLLDKKIINIEIDKLEVVEYEKSKIDQWQRTNVLPKRNLHFIGVDFSTEYKDVLWITLTTIKGSKKCIILIEGVLFFLEGKKPIICSISSTSFKIRAISLAVHPLKMN